MGMYFQDNGIVVLHDDLWLQRLKIAGKCVASVLNECRRMVAENTPQLSLPAFEDALDRIMNEYKCTPTFKGYKGFPSKLCISINRQLVHGIITNRVLQDGDVVKFDLGATYEGAIADAAITCIYGRPLNKDHIRLVEVCSGALNAGISAVKVGERLGVIGNAIHKFVKDSGFGLITDYGGHGLDYNKPHATPFVANKSSPNEGIRIQPGLTIAIEPMLVIGVPQTKLKEDGWTVICPDVGAHMEHTISIDKEHNVHIITSQEL